MKFLLSISLAILLMAATNTAFAKDDDPSGSSYSKLESSEQATPSAEEHDKALKRYEKAHAKAMKQSKDAHKKAMKAANNSH